MRELLIILALLVSSICVITILTFLKVTHNNRQKICLSCSKITDADNTISNLDKIIETSVVSVNQRMVSTLKEINSFAQSDKEEAFNECKKMIYSLTPYKTLETMDRLGMDTEEWINARTEYYVRLHKST